VGVVDVARCREIASGFKAAMADANNPPPQCPSAAAAAAAAGGSEAVAYTRPLFYSST